MVELLQVLQDFEKASGGIVPLMLFGFGAISAIVGLVLWLGGTSLLRISLLIIGTLVGFVFVLTVVEVSLPFALLVGLIVGGGGALLDKPAVSVLTAVLVLVLVFCFLARPFIESADAEGSVAESGNKLDWRQSLILAQSHAVGFDEAVSQVFWKMPRLNWAILGVAAAAGGIIGMKFQRTAMAFCFATSGTMFIFAGMVLVLLQRSIAAVSNILGKPPFYSAVFGGMILFGMFVQLIFCKRTKVVSIKGKNSGDDSDESSSVKKSWRTS